jgi:hypothetical protein
MSTAATNKQQQQQQQQYKAAAAAAAAAANTQTHSKSPLLIVTHTLGCEQLACSKLPDF